MARLIYQAKLEQAGIVLVRGVIIVLYRDIGIPIKANGEKPLSSHGYVGSMVGTGEIRPVMQSLRVAHFCG